MFTRISKYLPENQEEQNTGSPSVTLMANIYKSLKWESEVHTHHCINVSDNEENGNINE